MRELLLMWHCSATPEGKDYSHDQIMSWFKSMGWSNPGYRQITHLDGVIDVLQPYDSDSILESHEITNGAKGWNKRCVHYSYIGGVERHDITKAKDTRTLEQLDSMAAQTKEFLYKNPDAKVLGHNQIDRKACPSFYVPGWLREIGVPERNIYSTDLSIPRPSCILSSSYYEGDLFDIVHEQTLII